MEASLYVWALAFRNTGWTFISTHVRQIPQLAVFSGRNSSLWAGALGFPRCRAACWCPSAAGSSESLDGTKVKGRGFTARYVGMEGAGLQPVLPWQAGGGINACDLAASLFLEDKGKNRKTRSSYLYAPKIFLNRPLCIGKIIHIVMQHINNLLLSPAIVQRLGNLGALSRDLELLNWILEELERHTNHSLNTLKCCHFVNLFVTSSYAVSTYGEDGNWTLSHNLTQFIWKECDFPKPCNRQNFVIFYFYWCPSGGAHSLWIFKQRL